MSKKSWVALLFWVSLCLGVAAAGSFVTIPAIPVWYKSLLKPSWTPPDHVFGPVWTILYLMMAVAAWLVRRKTPVSRRTTVLFLLQLSLNLAWSFIFFGLKMPGLAFAEIMLLWAAIAATAFEFWKIARPAGAMLLPYLAWVTYAAALNFSIMRLN